MTEFPGADAVGPPSAPVHTVVVGRPPLARILRSLAQTLAAVVLAIPGAILAANQVAEQAGSDWRVPSGAWAVAAGGAGIAFLLTVAQNTWDQVKGKG